tara:strand:- start:200 stop:364 length:165 start_codon:yes stop_codon:yes gene_type:complete
MESVSPTGSSSGFYEMPPPLEPPVENTNPLETEVTPPIAPPPSNDPGQVLDVLV